MPTAFPPKRLIPKLEVDFFRITRRGSDVGFLELLDLFSKVNLKIKRVNKIREFPIDKIIMEIKFCT